MNRGGLFDAVADLYDEVRPDYPPELYDVLAGAAGPLAARRVLDLAAGSGLVTRALRARGADAVAVDLGPKMLLRLRRRSPDVGVAVAVAEALPFRAQVFDLVTCATAWHWLHVGRAVAEIRRVVRPGGHLALWWANHRVGDGVDWERAQSEVYARRNVDHGSRPPDTSGVGPREAADDLRRRGLDVVADQWLTWERTVTREQHLQVLRTHSDNLALGDGMEAFVAEVGQALAPWPVVTERLWGPLVVARVT